MKRLRAAAILTAWFVAMLAFLTYVVPYLWRAANAEPASYTCEQIREYVKEHGRWAALAKAKLSGATREQIKAARECLK